MIYGIIIIIVLQILVLKSVQQKKEQNKPETTVNEIILARTIMQFSERFITTDVSVFSFVKDNNLTIFIWDKTIHADMVDGYTLWWNLKYEQPNYKSEIMKVIDRLTAERKGNENRS